jgi:hypothetical protein
MAPMPTSSFDMSRVPMGGWNLPPYGSNASYALPGDNAHMGTYPTYYAPSVYLFIFHVLVSASLTCLCLATKPKFLCKTYEIPEAWSSPKGPSYSETSVVTLTPCTSFN